jgi:translation initiation factor IF-1
VPDTVQADEDWYGGTPQEEKQKFNDFVNQGSMFREWKKFNHPQFGEIEIGGWGKFTTRIPPTFLLPEMVHRNASHVLFVARNLPNVKLDVIEKKSLGNGLHRIRVRLHNDHAIPSLSNKIRKDKILRQDIVKIEGSGIEVVSGAFIDDIHMEQISPVEDRPWMIFTTVPSFGSREIQWIVRGSGAVKITYDAKKARNLSQTIQL